MVQAGIDKGEVVYGETLDGQSPSVSLTFPQVLTLASVAVPIHEQMKSKNSSRISCACFSSGSLQTSEQSQPLSRGMAQI